MPCTATITKSMLNCRVKRGRIKPQHLIIHRVTDVGHYLYIRVLACSFSATNISLFKETSAAQCGDLCSCIKDHRNHFLFISSKYSFLPQRHALIWSLTPLGLTRQIFQYFGNDLIKTHRFGGWFIFPRSYSYFIINGIF